MIRARTPVGPGKGDDDAALLRSQGGFIPQWSAAWRLGELFLFADKLAFAQPGKPRFELALATVTDVARERRKFILLHKDVVRLKYVLPNQKRSRLVWFITGDIGRWFDELDSHWHWCQHHGGRVSSSQLQPAFQPVVQLERHAGPVDGAPG